MNARQLAITAAILDALSQLDGGLLAEPLLHAAVQRKTTPAATLSDFEDRLRSCEAAKYVAGMDSKFGQRKWAITDAGELARRELNNG